jgi:hypothetical protein
MTTSEFFPPPVKPVSLASHDNLPRDLQRFVQKEWMVAFQRLVIISEGDTI